VKILLVVALFNIVLIHFFVEPIFWIASGKNSELCSWNEFASSAKNALAHVVSEIKLPSPEELEYIIKKQRIETLKIRRDLSDKEIKEVVRTISRELYVHRKYEELTEENFFLITLELTSKKLTGFRALGLIKVFLANVTLCFLILIVNAIWEDLKDLKSVCRDHKLAPTLTFRLKAYMSSDPAQFIKGFQERQIELRRMRDSKARREADSREKKRIISRLDEAVRRLRGRDTDAAEFIEEIEKEFEAALKKFSSDTSSDTPRQLKLLKNRVGALVEKTERRVQKVTRKPSQPIPARKVREKGLNPRKRKNQPRTTAKPREGFLKEKAQKPQATTEKEWKIFFIPKNGNSKTIEISLAVDSFHEVIIEYRRNVPTKAVYNRICQLLYGRTPRQRADFPKMKVFFSGFSKCRAGRTIRIFFKVDEENKVFSFTAYHRKYLGTLGPMRYR